MPSEWLDNAVWYVAFAMLATIIFAKSCKFQLESWQISVNGLYSNSQLCVTTDTEANCQRVYYKL